MDEVGGEESFVTQEPPADSFAQTSASESAAGLGQLLLLGRPHGRT